MSAIDGDRDLSISSSHMAVTPRLMRAPFHPSRATIEGNDGPHNHVSPLTTSTASSQASYFDVPLPFARKSPAVAVSFEGADNHAHHEEHRSDPGELRPLNHAFARVGRRDGLPEPRPRQALCLPGFRFSKSSSMRTYDKLIATIRHRRSVSLSLRPCFGRTPPLLR